MLFISRLFLVLFLLSLLPLQKAIALTEPSIVVEENLVHFSIFSQSDPTDKCLGIRVAESLITTSPECVEGIGQQLKKNDISVLDINDNLVGKIKAVSERIIYGTKEPDLLLLMTEIATTGIDIYPELYNSDVLPEKTFSYFFDFGQAVIEEPVTLTPSSVSGHLGYFDISSKTELLPGTPVMDEEQNLVCLVTSNNQCRTLSPALINRHSRNLQQYDDDNDDYDDALTEALPFVVISVIGGAVVAAATTSFYVILMVRAKHKGMTTGAYFSGICSCAYCAGWSSLSTVFCVMGAVICPFTYAICSTPCWWAAPFSAAWNWIDDNGRAPFIPLTEVVVEAPK